MVTFTRQQALEAIQQKNLIPNEIYQISNAVGNHCIVRLSAVSAEKLARKPVVPTLLGADFDMEVYDLQTDKLHCSDLISCVVRSIGGHWGMIQDNGHESRHVASVNGSGSQCIINYIKTYNKVQGSQANIDETYSQSALGITCGASVGLGRSVLHVHKTILSGNALMKIPVNPAEASIPGSNIWFSATCVKSF
jgi:hypothetical protein